VPVSAEQPLGCCCAGSNSHEPVPAAQPAIAGHKPLADRERLARVFIRHCDENPAISQQIRDSHEMDVGSLRRMVSDELGVQEMFFRQSDIGPNFVSFLQRVLGLVLQSDRYVARQIDESKPFLINAHDTLRDIGPQLQEWARVIEATGLQFTIALDRFDDFIDNLVSDDLPRTRKIRRFFLQGLVPTLSKLDNDKSFAWLRVVASLPEDLVVDIALREIASHKKLHFVEIDWSRGNLVSLLDGRVSSVLPGITFSEIFSYQVPNLNHLVLTKETPEDYLIRHTTRRPREVMAHAARLFTFMRKQRRVPSPREYGEIIHLSNKEIVEDQVFPEWQSVLPSIRSFFSGMARRSPPTVFTLAEFEQWDQASSSVGLHRYGENMLSGEAKSFTALAALFRVGSVGFRVRRASRRDGYIRQGDNDFVRYIFAFTSKRDPISDIVDFLLRPNLPELVETSEGKSYRGTLLGQDHGIYDIALCFSPMFFEVAGAEHMSPYLVGEHLEESVY